ncbi:restriction endonuclease subunit S [Enterococcus cecorum]|nr:restriction endonuclease subunit S [Enterococcus cecorum]
MNEKKKMQPKVRFREFTGENASDWEQRKLGEVSNHRGGTAIEKYFDDNGKYKVISIGSYGLDSRYVDQGIRAHSNEITDKRIVYAGELTMILNDKTANGTIIGRTLLIENDNEYVVNQRTEIISPNEGFNSRFAYTLLNGPFRHKIKQVVQGGTQIYVNYSSVEKLTLYLPIIEEQKKVGVFFEKLDKLITLHQRKLEQLEQLKNTLLSKMFPKSGTNIPEIRFSGFTDAWKQRKLEEIIVKEIKGKAKSENISTNFANKGSLYLDTEYLNGGKPKYVSLPSDTDENDIIILWDGSQAGKLYKGVVGALGSTLKAYKIPEHTLFYYYQMLGSQEKIYNQYRTPNIPHVVKSFTSEFMIWDTSNDEKTLIIDIYSNLFNYIAIHQRKLDQLKNLKQTLLNKMFI